MQNYIGKQIDRYRITERLGQGGMAVVYKAYDTRLERDVAIKLIRTGSIPPDQYDRLMKRFEREAKSQAKFMHRHIIPVHDYGEVDDAPYLVMSYIPGGTLKEKMKGPVDWHQAVRWLIPIAEALSYAHQRGVIHRDVKPSNILFDDEGQPILTDFGIAKILETDEATLTGTGFGVGTPEYMAPEQWRGQVSEATDQYALGVVLYELITGQKPYTADTPAAIILMQATEPLMAPSKIVGDIPDSVEKVLYKALAKDPQDRFEDLGTFQKALEGLLEVEVTREKVAQPRSETIEPPFFNRTTPIADSEARTYDILETDPHPQTNQKLPLTQPKPSTKREEIRSVMPIWVWSMGGVLILTVIVLIGLLLSNRDDSLPGQVSVSNTDTPRVITAKETQQPEPTQTKTLSPTRTPTPTKTRTPTYTPTEALDIGSTTENTNDGAMMVYVPAGEFLMGSEAPDADSDEAPEHTVYMDSYWIYQHEVTNAQFSEFLNAEGNQTEGGVTWLDAGDPDARIHQTSGEWTPDAGYADHPVVEVSWYGAKAYCQSVGGRLPTEAEWEKAARGTEGQTYPWGNTNVNGQKANFCDTNCSFDWADTNQDDGFSMTAPVGSYPDGASPYGALDMAGNVWEWVADWYDAEYYGTSLLENPQGPSSGTYRVSRGGSWFDDERYLRASDRLRGNPDFADLIIGFRCVRSP